jgi:hypothetical protein
MQAGTVETESAFPETLEEALGHRHGFSSWGLGLNGTAADGWVAAAISVDGRFLGRCGCFRAGSEA